MCIRDSCSCCEKASAEISTDLFPLSSISIERLGSISPWRIIDSDADRAGSTSFQPGSNDAQLSSMLPVLAQFEMSCELAAISAISELERPVQAHELRALRAAQDNAELDLSPWPIGIELSTFHPNWSGVGRPLSLQHFSTAARSPFLSSSISTASSTI